MEQWLFLQGKATDLSPNSLRYNNISYSYNTNNHKNIKLPDIDALQ